MRAGAFRGGGSDAAWDSGQADHVSFCPHCLGVLWQSPKDDLCMLFRLWLSRLSRRMNLSSWPLSL